jgi:hypothetical protein
MRVGIGEKPCNRERTRRTAWARIVHSRTDLARHAWLEYWQMVEYKCFIQAAGADSSLLLSSHCLISRNSIHSPASITVRTNPPFPLLLSSSQAGHCWVQRLNVQATGFATKQPLQLIIVELGTTATIYVGCSKSLKISSFFKFLRTYMTSLAFFSKAMSSSLPFSYFPYFAAIVARPISLFSKATATQMYKLKVPKCENFHRSDFFYFYTIKPLWVGDFRVKIKNSKF